jgi:hypothetical protein
MTGDWDDELSAVGVIAGEAAPDAQAATSQDDAWGDVVCVVADEATKDEATKRDTTPDDAWISSAGHTEAAPLVAAEDAPAEAAADAAVVLAARPVAGEVLRELAARIRTDPEGLVVDASAVERLPMPVIQVLLAGAGELRAAGRGLRVRNPSFTFGLAFEALGFTGEREIFTVEYC